MTASPIVCERRTRNRFTELHKPDPDNIGQVSTLPSVKIQYLLTSNPTTQPYSILFTQSHIGPGLSDGNYVSAYAYVDGLGRTLVTLEQADKTAGDLGDWVAAGLTDYDNKGAVRKVFLKWFW